MTETLAALLIFLFPLAYGPGPGNMVFAAMGARHGMRGTWRASLGYHVATWGVTLAIGLGASAALAERPGIAGAIRLVGALYVRARRERRPRPPRPWAWAAARCSCSSTPRPT
jgi:threonine/homoserine/homoserine lactone efflux protein